MASGDDIKAGRASGANSSTFVVGEKPDDDNPPDFNGDFIFVVGPLKNPVVRSPGHTTGGILALGCNGPVPSPGGVGVSGVGGPNQGTGVQGTGGAGDSGRGGIGVQGIGGSIEEGPTEGNEPLPNPGLGVIGQGGTQNPHDTSGAPHGAGVVGVAGAANIPDFPDMGSVGVFGQGGDAVRRTSIDGSGKKRKKGPHDPGAGIIGRGGSQKEDGSFLAMTGPGVAGQADLPPLAETGSVGVHGSSHTGVGVKGHSNTIAGVHGRSDRGRGGLFESGDAAQINLKPLENHELPFDGQTGDLLVLTRNAGTSDQLTELWFCPQGATSVRKAGWKSVQLGLLVQT